MPSTTFTRVAAALIAAAGCPDWIVVPYALELATVRLQAEYRGPQTQSATTRQQHGKRSEIWWRGDDARIQFGIDNRCSTELELIFQQAVPLLKTFQADIERKETVLLSLLAHASTTNESEVVQAVEDLEASRRSLARTFTMMQYYMYLRLTSSQRAKVHAYLYHGLEEPAKARSTPP